MSKRPVVDDVENGNQAYLKRQKIKHVSTVPAETVQSSRQLHQLLAFDQDVAKAKHGIQSFKTFLDGLSTDDRSNRLSILSEFLISQTPRDDSDKNATYLEAIIQTWSFASQINNDSLLSLIPAVLTLLLRSISGVLHLAEYGILVGRTLLQKQQLLLFSRNLTANKTKAFIVSPTLQLLREVACFDGGSQARQVFRSREFTLKSLPRNLGLRFQGDGLEDKSKPSIRTNSVLFVSSLLKFCPVEAKKELLNQKDIVSALMREIGNDPPHVIVEILEALRSHVLRDEKLPREAKSRLLNPANLGRLVTLYHYDDNDTSTVNQSIHEFLTLACTSNDQGVLYRQSGFYPKGVDADSVDEDDLKDFINLGLDSIEWMDKFSDRVSVRNTTLSEFAQTLRPWSDTRQAELLLNIFKAAPELVADYFFNKRSFTFEPKLTATWIGYSAFLYSALQLDVPKYFGHKHGFGKLPPPSSIVIESILPLPLSQKVVSKCLNQSSMLIKFFAVRILIVAFEKLSKALNMYREAAIKFPNWAQAAIQLIQMFSQRCPAMKDVLGVFRTTSIGDVMMRHAISRLLVLYYEVTPQIALESKFDVATALTQMLELLDETPEESKDFTLRVMEAENLFMIAHSSPGMRWFNKAESRPTSPFTTMLRLASREACTAPISRMHTVLIAVTKESGILQSQTSPTALRALLTALHSVSTHTNIDAVYLFLDDCALRCSNTSIKYIDAVEKIRDLCGIEDDQTPLSLLLMAIAEQWPFLVKSDQSSSIEAVAEFLAAFFSALITVHEDKKILKTVIKHAAKELPEESASRKIIEKSKTSGNSSDVLSANVAVSQRLENIVKEEEVELLEAEATLAGESRHSLDDSSANLRWVNREMDEIIEDGHAASLIMLLSSSHLTTRKEALTNVLKLAMKIKESTFEEKDQIWLLLCELAESAKPHTESEPIPTIISAFAAQSIQVLKDPLHCLYPKLMLFLTQGPTWELGKVPLMHNILDESPSLDDAYYREVSWLLSLLRAGLRTEADMAIYYKRHVFEKLLSIYSNAYLANGLKEKILSIIYSCTEIKHASTTLVTRVSILSWLDAELAIEGSSASLVVLKKRVLATLDSVKVQEWSSNALKGLA